MTRESGSGGLGREHAFAAAILLPAFCMVPWLAAMAGRGPMGVDWGLFAKVTITIEPLKESIVVLEAANRLQSASGAMLLVFVAGVVGIFALWRTWTTARRTTDRLVLSITWLFVAAAFAYALRQSADGVRAYTVLGNVPDGRSLFVATLGKIDNGRPLQLLDCQLDWANGSVAFAAVSLALAASSIGIAAHRLAGKADLPVLDDLARRLDLILLLSAVVLAVGVIGVKLWHAGPLPFIAKNAAAYTSLADAYLAFQSVCYVGVLSGIYLPAAIALQHRRSLIDATPKKSASEEMNPALQSLLRVFAILSPVLVGPLASIAGLKFPT